MVDKTGVAPAHRSVAAPVAGPAPARWLALAAVVLVVDQLTKAWIRAAFVPGEVLPVTGFFSLVLTFNTGAAFSFLANAGGWQRWFFALVALIATGVILWLLRRGGSRLYCAGLTLVLGGAVGNLVDRLWLGKVVDFLLFHYAGWFYPAFNAADSAITVGAGLIILDSLRHRAPPARPREP